MVDNSIDPSYYPHLWELAILLLTTVELLLAGAILRRQWTSQNEVMPVPVAVLLWVLIMGLYGSVTLSFILTTEPDRKFTLLIYSLGFSLFPLLYCTRLVADSVAVRTTDRISPFGSQIEDPSEFAAARKLALRGDIDGAVSMYRSYGENKGAAMFEAARLLKSQDRFAEAIALYEEVSQLFYGKRRVWGEAMYNIGKIREVNLGETRAAMEIYYQVVNRTAESRYGQLAGSDLSRLQVLDKGFLQTISAGAEGQPGNGDPFFRTRTQGEGEPAEAAAAGARSASPLDDDYEEPGEQVEVTEREEEVGVPPIDPFFAMRKAQADLPEAETEVRAVPTKKKAPAKAVKKRPPRA